VPGELYIGGMGVARGYLRSPEQTAERFVPHPFSTVSGRRLYKTGDLVRYWPDGAIEYLGRLDHQVKIRGYRVELGEIEARLREHPQIREAVVTAHDDGSGGKRVVGYVVRRDAGQFDMAAIRHFLKERLPEYMVPSACVFVAALPLTSNGKVDRKALPPPDAPGQARNRYIAPRTPVEKILAEIWTDLLTAPSIGVEDNFFDLGGHSLLAIQLMHRIQKSLGISLSLTAVFEAPTLAGLSERVEQGRAGASLLVPLRASGSQPALYCLDPTGSHVSAYQALAKGLNLNRPVYGLELRPSVAAQDALVLAIAQEQAAAIRSHQPDGPYHLLGWSLGGVFAVAVAHALERQGQSVGFLGILDTQARLQTYGTEENQDPLAELAEYVHLDRRHDVLSISDQDRLALLNQLAEAGTDDRPEVVIRWAQTRGLLAGEMPAEALKLRYFLLRNAAHFMKTGLVPCLRAPIHVWWTSDTLQRYGRIPIAWEDYTSAGIHVEVIDGDHMEVVKNPHIIAKIDQCLASLDR
jgi:thioesterase domain-containing protein/acyl carrier protein